MLVDVVLVALVIVCNGVVLMLLVRLDGGANA